MPQTRSALHQLARLGGRADLSAAGVRRAAERRTGLSRWDPRGDEGLDVLTRSLEDDARLHALGRHMVRSVLVQAACVHLRQVAAQAEPVSGHLRRPLIVVSMPRTGSTLLQRLLAAQPTAASLPMWLQSDPLPPPRRRTAMPRRVRAQLPAVLVPRLIPGIRLRHEVLPHEPEECSYLMMGSFTSLTFWSFWPVHGYADWLESADPTWPYGFFRDVLLRLQPAVPGTHWVLKSPMHFLFLQTVLDCFPEAGLVLLHRDPAAVIPSTASLFATMHGSVSDDPRGEQTDARNLRVLAEAAERVTALRDAVPDRFFDVRYDDLLADPLATLQAIHDRFDLPPIDPAPVQAWLAANPQHKHGVHRYTAAGDAAVGRFSAYRRRFLEPS